MTDPITLAITLVVIACAVGILLWIVGRATVPQVPKMIAYGIIFLLALIALARMLGVTSLR